MNVNFNERTGVGASKTEARNSLAQCQEVSRGSFVERVCSFLEQYPLSHADEHHPSLKNTRPHRSDFSWRSSKTVAGVSSD
jgi:hypothetical protein